MVGRYTLNIGPVRLPTIQWNIKKGQLWKSKLDYFITNLNIIMEIMANNTLKHQSQSMFNIVIIFCKNTNKYWNIYLEENHFLQLSLGQLLQLQLIFSVSCFSCCCYDLWVTKDSHCVSQSKWCNINPPTHPICVNCKCTTENLEYLPIIMYKN